MKKFALIVAGGSGTRMNLALPKQFIELCGKPILMHTIEAFFRFDNNIKIILALPETQLDYWQKLSRKHKFSIAHEVVAGGETRFHTVKNGLAAIPNEGLVAIHDGVRPLVSSGTIERCFSAAAEHGNAIPCFPVYETVRQVKNETNTTIDRASLRLIQTPQVFLCSVIKKAFNRKYDHTFTDDASVLEAAGKKIHLVEGNRENIKVTDLLDLSMVEALLKSGAITKRFNVT
jgi:2-C-methyl-D-erythritol 4-phosphate cytidylyltransferase